LRSWLGFPNNTEMLAAYFVLHLMCAFKNSDILLFKGVWRAYRVVKVSMPVPLPYPLLQTLEKQGLALLTDFVLHLLPVGLAQAIAHPTPLQQSAIECPDFYLPFRELAPCHRRVTSEEGPYHPALSSEPGAFPSWCIFHALLFDSDTIHNHTKGYFCDRHAWEVFLTAQGFDNNNKESVDCFFNIGCYGSLQRQRRQGTKPIPFKKFYLWLQELPRENPVTKPKYAAIPDITLPLLGNLTAYLVAADISYTGKVEAPTISDMVFAIHHIGKGAYKGLMALNLLSPSEQKDSVEKVEVAFSQVYAHLQATIPIKYHKCIVLDGIMVEHTLCKYKHTEKKKR
ncbi:hypothetical protein C8Q80DRAFT_1096121, partial [Daedaleopsis nitida]